MDSRYLDQPVNKLTEPPRQILHADSENFIALTKQLCEIHMKKSHDYGHNNQPLANFEESVRFGVRPFTGIMLRMNDKMIRIQNFIDKGNLQNESVGDSLLDIAAYALLGIIQLQKESRPGDGSR